MSETETVQPEEPTPSAPPIVAAPVGPRVCFVKFRNAGRVYPFAAGELELLRGDLVLVDHEQTQQVGTVMREPAPSTQSAPTKVLRLLSTEDRARLDTLRGKEREIFKFTLAEAHKKRLPVKMVAADLSFNEDRLQIYFASEERLDFRALIRDVSARYQTRVDIRQIGARDAAKIIGGVGSCGRELCCSTWLVEFRPVSIKMAKDQNLALNPQKVSGVCGRLLCCLTYEQETYRELRRGLPKIGKRVYTPNGEGRVKDTNVLRRRVRVQTVDGYEEFDAEQVSPMFGPTGELLQPGNLVVEAEEAEGESEAESGTTQVAPPMAARPARDTTERPAPARAERPAGDRPPRDDRPRQDRPQGERPPRQDRPQGERPPRQDRPQGDRPPRQDRPQGDRPPRQDRPQGDRPPRQDRPQGDRPPRQDRPQGDRPPRQDRPQGDRPAQERPRTDLPPNSPSEANEADDEETLDDQNEPGTGDQPTGEQPAGGDRPPGTGPRRRRRRRRGRGGGGGGQGGGNRGPGSGGNPAGGGGNPGGSGGGGGAT